MVYPPAWHVISTTYSAGNVKCEMVQKLGVLPAEERAAELLCQPRARLVLLVRLAEECSQI